MVSIVLALCALSALPRGANDIDGQDAVKIARKFASDVGIHGTLRLTSLQQIDGKRWGYGDGLYQQTLFSSSDKRQVWIDVSNQGQVQMLRFPPKEGIRSISKIMLNGIDLSKMAQQLLKSIPAPGKCVLRPFPPGAADPFQHAFFDLIVAGHRFFNLNPTYAYSFEFDAQTGETSYYSRPPHLPDIAASVATISGVAAISRLETWARKNSQRGIGVISMYGPKSVWNPTAVPELGYHKFRNEPKARLVWRTHVWSHLQSVPSSEAGLIRMYVDAVTGELIAPDDPGIN